MLVEGEIAHVKYEKVGVLEVDGAKTKTVQITERNIVPTSMPNDYIKALDVSYLNDEERQFLIENHEEYRKYVRQHMRNMFGFKEWLDITHPGKSLNNELPEVKHRTFTLDKLSEI